MTEYAFTITVRTDRDRQDIGDTLHDVIEDLRAGFLGDPSDWGTFELVGIEP